MIPSTSSHLALLLSICGALVLPTACFGQVVVPQAQARQGAPEVVDAGQAYLSVVGGLSVGIPVRLRRDRRLGQGRLAPAYSEFSFAAFLPGDGWLQHGIAVGVGLGLSEDGGFYEPVPPFEQWSGSAGYAARLRLGPDWLSIVHLAVPVTVGHGLSLGADVGVALGYRLLAGVAVTAELSAVGYFGVERRLYPMLAAEVGVQFDYEVLP